MTFGERIRQLRDSRHISQKNMGDTLGLNRGTLSKYELGEREPNMETIIRIAYYFGVTLDWLFGRETGNVSDLGRTIKTFESLSDDEQAEMGLYMDFLLHRRNVKV